MYSYNPYYEKYLAHYGRKGMKWNENIFGDDNTTHNTHNPNVKTTSTLQRTYHIAKSNEASRNARANKSNYDAYNESVARLYRTNSKNRQNSSADARWQKEAEYQAWKDSKDSMDAATRRNEDRIRQKDSEYEAKQRETYERNKRSQEEAVSKEAKEAKTREEYERVERKLNTVYKWVDEKYTGARKRVLLGLLDNANSLDEMNEALALVGSILSGGGPGTMYKPGN